MLLRLELLSPHFLNEDFLSIKRIDKKNNIIQNTQVVKTMVSEFKSQHLSFWLCWIWYTAEAKAPNTYEGQLVC